MATSQNVLITSVGIKKSLKKYKPLNSIAEYVWNGFDANATTISISIEVGALGKIQSISISDNGDGIEKDLLSHKFKPFYSSQKTHNPAIMNSVTHGKNGIGRLTFFSFARDANWQTVYEKDNQKLQYSISISSDNLDHYTATEETVCAENIGTTVCFDNIFDWELSLQNIRDFLCKEFCWFLELHKNDNYSITVNGEEINYSANIIKREVRDYIYKDQLLFTVTFINWAHKLTEYSKYYYIKSDGVELAKENTTFNNKGDNFYHSVFIKSKLFDNFDISAETITGQQTLALGKNKKSPEYIFIIEQVNKLIFDNRKPFLKDNVSNIIENLDIKSAFPNFNKTNPLDVYKEKQIEDLVKSLYVAQPKIFSGVMNKEQKKTFIRLLDLIMESGQVNALFEILREILDMDSNEREELADMLRFASMSNITKTIKLINDRYKAVDSLKALVFNKALNANEVNHIQSFIEQHYWLFGEQYNLVTAAEPNFTEALRRFKYLLHEEYKDVEVHHVDRLKQMDIFAVRQDVAQGFYNNIVVELKHPDIVIGEKQLSQVKKYMDVILNIDTFNAQNMTWEFYLVGNKLNDYIKREIENNKHHGQPSLVFNVNNYKIFVKTWSEMFADFEIRYSHLNKKLNLQRKNLQETYNSADEVLNKQSNNSAIMAPELVLAK